MLTKAAMETIGRLGMAATLADISTYSAMVKRILQSMQVRLEDVTVLFERLEEKIDSKDDPDA